MTKQKSRVLKGAAILSMLMLHLFCRKANLPYTPLLWVGGTPLIYYFGLFGDVCVAMFCFISGYAHELQFEKAVPGRERWKHLLKFLISFWVIAIMTAVTGMIIRDERIPGSLEEFLLNFFAIRNSYNGAWWYVNTYILLILLQPLSCQLVRRLPAWLAGLFAFAFYTVGYGIRFFGWGASSLSVLSWAIMRVGLLGTSYFPYLIGMLFAKNNILNLLYKKTINMNHACLYVVSIAVVVGMLVFHSFVQSLYIAAFTAIAIISILCVLPLPTWIERGLAYLGVHSGNIWLVHMFFYANLFEGFVFRAKYPVLIFLLLLALSLAVSYVVNWLSRPIQKLVR